MNYHIADAYIEKAATEGVPVERNPLQVHDIRTPVSRALGTEHSAANYVDLE
jgi:hypothetical protein